MDNSSTRAARQLATKRIEHSSWRQKDPAPCGGLTAFTHGSRPEKKSVNWINPGSSCRRHPDSNGELTANRVHTRLHNVAINRLKSSCCRRLVQLFCGGFSSFARGPRPRDKSSNRRLIVDYFQNNLGKQK